MTRRTLVTIYQMVRRNISGKLKVNSVALRTSNLAERSVLLNKSLWNCRTLKTIPRNKPTDANQ